jgi:hypothetical protein
VNPAAPDGGSDYNAVMGSHLDAGLMNLNQLPMSVITDPSPDGTTQAINLQIPISSAARWRGFKPPCELRNPAVQRTQSVSQSLRAFPQYLTVDAAAGGGDRSSHSTHHAILKINHRMSGFLTFGSYSFSKMPGLPIASAAAAAP